MTTVGLSVIATVRAVPAALPDRCRVGSGGCVGRRSRTGCSAATRSYAVDWTEAELFGTVGTGVFAELARLGYDVAVLHGAGAGVRFTACGPTEDVDGQVLVISSSDIATGVDPPPGAAEVARAESAAGEHYAVFVVSG